MTVSAIGKVQAFNAQAEHARGAAHDAGRDDEEISPVSPVRKSGAAGRHRTSPITIDLRPDPPAQSTGETAHKARRYTLDGEASRGGGSARRRAAEAAPEPQWTYRANPDTPYRRRSSDETYQAVETADTPVPHRGGIYDRRI